MKFSFMFYFAALVASQSTTFSLAPSPTESTGCTPHNDHWHCETARTTPLTTTTTATHDHEEDDHDHDHEEDNHNHSDAEIGSGSLAPSPTESMGCVAHEDHWHCEAAATGGATATATATGVKTGTGASSGNGAATSTAAVTGGVGRLGVSLTGMLAVVLAM